MRTLTSQEIDYAVASFKAWCATYNKSAPTADDAFVYFSYVQEHEPFMAELIADDWEDFLAFLKERHLLVGTKS